MPLYLTDDMSEAELLEAVEEQRSLRAAEKLRKRLRELLLREEAYDWPVSKTH